MTCTDLDTSIQNKYLPTSAFNRQLSPLPEEPHSQTTYVQPFSIPVQVLSLGWTVQKSPIRAGWEAHSQEQPGDTYWETQASNGKQQETATKDCLSSASLVCVLNHKKNTVSSITIWYITTFIHFVFFTESGRSIACAGHNTTLRCGSGRVLMIDGGFYGRKNIHYCRSPPLTSPTQIQCGWVDAAEALRGKNTVRLYLCAIQTCIISILCSCLSCNDNWLLECYTITQPSAVNWSGLHNNHSQLE